MNQYSVNNQLFFYNQTIWDLGCHHVFTTRPLDFDLFKNENNKNIELLKQVLNTSGHIYYMHQQHTNKIIDINQTEMIQTKIGYYYEGVDGLLSNQSNQVLLSTYADCTPFLIYDPLNKVQVNLHSGWRGYLSNILLNALKLFSTKNIHVLSGPHLLVDDFEVDWDVASLFLEKYPQIKNLVHKRDSKYHIDLNVLTHYFCDLKQIPLENRHFINLSTLQDERLHSFRKDKADFKKMALVSTLVD